jgi:hypothetical protein
MLTTITAFICLSAPVVLPARVEADYREQVGIMANGEAQGLVVGRISSAIKFKPTPPAYQIVFSGFPKKVEYKPGCKPYGIAAMGY